LLELQYRAQAIDWNARFTESHHELVLLGGEPVGRIWVARTQRECRIVDLTLVPERRRTGLGSRLVAEVLLAADEAGVLTRLSVLRGNEPALAFWRCHGFVETHADALYLGLERRAQA
jgi:ribosomal protein S18 acetylase RimI-like enzyme